MKIQWFKQQSKIKKVLRERKDLSAKSKLSRRRKIIPKPQAGIIKIGTKFNSEQYISLDSLENIGITAELFKYAI